MRHLRLSSLIILICLTLGISSAYAQAAKVAETVKAQRESAKTPAVTVPNGAQPAKPADGAQLKQPGPAKPGQDLASRSAKPAAPAKETVPKFNVEDFTFHPESSRNPFEPILLLKAKTSRGLSVRTTKEKTSKTTKTTKEKLDKVDYELEELRLVGVIKSGTGMIAMMEDTQGKGIFFRKGDYLNKNMWVVDVMAGGITLGYKTKGEIKKIDVDIPRKN